MKGLYEILALQIRYSWARSLSLDYNGLFLKAHFRHFKQDKSRDKNRPFAVRRLQNGIRLLLRHNLCMHGL